ncbi:MAG: YdbH domain-containing protein [Proteobacteria bacterium]|nr:YdbH domain-containing protein [Pseudomonadota bacterium]
MGRRLVISLILGLGLALAALYVFRAAAVEALIANALATRGVAVGGLSVTRVGLDQIRIAELSLGAHDELRVRALRIGYRPTALLRGEIENIAVAGLVLRLDLSGAAPPLGSLQPLLANRDGGAPGPLPVIEFSDIRMEVATRFGPMVATLDGEAWPEDAGEIAGAFSFTLASAQGRLIGAFDLSRTAAGAMTGNLVVEDGVLRLPGAEATGLLGEASYALAPGRPPKLDAWLSAARIALPGAVLGETRIDLRAVEKTAALTARLGGAGRAWSLALTATLEDYLEAPSVRFDMTGEAESGAAVWPLLALPDPAAGMVIVRTNFAGRLAPFSELGGDGATMADWLARATLEGQVAATLGGLTYPERVETVSGRLRIAAALEDGTLTFRSAAPTRLVLANLAPDWLRDLGLPASAVPLLERGVNLALIVRGTGDRNGLAGPVSLTLRTPGGAKLNATSQMRIEVGRDFAIERLNLDQLRVAVRRLPMPGFRLRSLYAVGALAGKPPALAGELELGLDAADITVQALRAAAAQAVLPIALEVTPGAVSLRLTGPGRVTFDEVSYGETVQLAALAVAVPEGELSLTDGVLDHTATLALAPSQARLIRADGDLVVELAPGPLRIQGSWRPGAPYRGTLRLESSILTLPARNLLAEGIEANLSLGAAPVGLAAELILGALTDRAEAPLFAPLGGRLTLRGDGQTVTFEGQIGNLSGAARLAIAGRHNLAAGRGRAEIVLDPLTFDPGGLQPGALAPPLAGLRDVSGGLQADATLAWAPGEMSGAARLRLDDLSFGSDAAAVQGLDLDLRLDRLFPPGSPPGQRLSVRRIDPGVALDDIDVRFQVRPGAPTRLAIERGALSVSGGRLLLRDLLVDPAAERQDLAIEVEGLALAELFRILDVEGLSGTGRLSGRIPIALVGETVIVEAGRLEADAPGRLRFRSEQAAQALAGAGESADLMLRVLQDFHYDELSLTIDKPAETDARLALVLLGNNPDVLDGYPFRLNINLEGDIGKLAEALRQAYSLSNRMLRRVWR